MKIQKLRDPIGEHLREFPPQGELTSKLRISSFGALSCPQTNNTFSFAETLKTATTVNSDSFQEIVTATYVMKFLLLKIGRSTNLSHSPPKLCNFPQ